jgi:hypothetical protein
MGSFPLRFILQYFQYLDHIAMNATSRINELEGTVIDKSRYYAGMSEGLSKTTRNLRPDSQCPSRDLNWAPLHYKSRVLMLH